jgi:hypothetical protein
MSSTMPPRGVSDPQLHEAGEFVSLELERLVEELGSRYPTLTLQRALFMVVLTTLGVAVKIGGPYDEEFQAQRPLRPRAKPNSTPLRRRCVRARSCGARLAKPRPGTLLWRRVQANGQRHRISRGAL